MRGKTIPAKELLRTIKSGEEAAEYPDGFERPMARGDCVDGPRPCPLVSCQYNLYLDISKSGALKFNFPDVEVEDMKESCVLDVADRGGITLEEVGQIMNLTRERIRQVELRAIDKVKNTSAGIFGCHYCGCKLELETANPVSEGYACIECFEEHELET